MINSNHIRFHQSQIALILNSRKFHTKLFTYSKNHISTIRTTVFTVLPYFSDTQIQLRPSIKWSETFGKITRPFFFSTPQVVPVMPPCVTSAMSVGNLNQVRDGNGTSAVSQSNNNNKSINNSNINNNNNNRVSSAVSAGNVSKIHTPKVTGELNVLSMMFFLCVFMCAVFTF